MRKLLGCSAACLAQELRNYPAISLKGTKVTVTGQFVLESWTAKDGTEKSTPVVIVNDIDFTSKQEGQPKQNKPPVSNEAQPPFDEDSEIPF